jgi:hypothetical protein
MEGAGGFFALLAVVWFLFVLWWMLGVRSSLSEIAGLLREIRQSLWLQTGEDQEESEA